MTIRSRVRGGTRSLSALAVLVLVVALPLVALAADGEHAEGGHGGIDIKTLGLQLLNFGALLFILIKFGGGAISKALRSRHDALKTELEQAQKLRAEAEERMAVQSKRLENLENEMKAMRERLKTEAASEKVRLVAAAEARARRVQNETKFLLEQQIKQAELAFRAEVATAAARVAEELVRKSAGPDDDRRLVDAFVGDVENSNRGERAGGMG